MTPGQADSYVASVGYMLYGMPGAILTTLIIVLPGYLMLAALKGYERFRYSARVRGFTKGITATSVGLILAAVLQIGETTLTDPIAWVVLAATLAMTQLLKWNIFVALGAATVLGLMLALWLPPA